MNEEMKSLQKNETWEFVDCPPGKKPVGCHWIYTMKYKTDGSIEHFKARLVEAIPRAWFGRFTKSMRAFGYRQSNSVHTLIMKKQHDKITTLIVYVDDMVVTGNDPEERKALQNYLSRVFEMKYLCPLKYFLGIEVSRSSEGIFLSQRNLIKYQPIKEDDSSLAAEVAMAPSDSGSIPATAPFDSCPIGVSADSCPAGAP
ncbi:Retrovirus-related Pol polyprotein from transposon RE1 [Vitis vinifera]|uniref:Retrovirus-related Pol polyprotein from transposon RE1 n=1 Tax=Vitis vinifera TaxID=29760 RepID=A0A438FVQ6_VITVI|nr:Retrovirus-related Pol polyprotein from transposon RE1 [Vitis vinifera]